MAGAAGAAAAQPAKQEIARRARALPRSFCRTSKSPDPTLIVAEAAPAVEQQTQMLLQTKLAIGMGLPFNVHGNRRESPFKATAPNTNGASAQLSPLEPLGV
eukprot:CAMPEP_0172068958 /NCGR_PEP_ID=MMETSP1043-20130122/12484_1 /TAXON_ID=464988 /ORGANISM="Hemiselmis andersenii, Strain CCMP441" /LENGTH=101 /DNA_ID=CAMNT_0012729243 /DNA_START=542 /DNA_END=846 /DNA_ORIENTATION=-